MLNRPEEYERMRAAEDRLWWYRCLHGLVLDALRRGGLAADAPILDAGCGTGGLLARLQREGYTAGRGFDVSPHAVRFGRARGLPVAEGDLRALAGQAAPASQAAVVACDTLYFLGDDERRAFVNAAAQLLRPAGLLVVNVPALAAFGGAHDVSVGIGRRFNRADLAAMLNHPGFEPPAVRFWPFLLSPLIYAVRARQRRQLRRAAHAAVHSDVTVPPAWLNALLLAVTRLEFRLLPGAPFGSSLFAVAVRRA